MVCCDAASLAGSTRYAGPPFTREADLKRMTELRIPRVFLSPRNLSDCVAYIWAHYRHLLSKVESWGCSGKCDEVMDQPVLPPTAERLGAHLVALRNARRARRHQRRIQPSRRRGLTPAERALVLSKTASRCHICGGSVAQNWQADHVLAHSSGGGHAHDNYLPAHALCNNNRWDYSAEEFQWVLKMGVWARHEMKRGGPLGSEILNRFFEYECRPREETEKQRAAV
jgi:hypothetical protein